MHQRSRRAGRYEWAVDSVDKGKHAIVDTWRRLHDRKIMYVCWVRQREQDGGDDECGQEPNRDSPSTGHDFNPVDHNL